MILESTCTEPVLNSAVGVNEIRVQSLLHTGGGGGAELLRRGRSWACLNTTLSMLMMMQGEIGNCLRAAATNILSLKGKALKLLSFVCVLCLFDLSNDV